MSITESQGEHVLVTRIEAAQLLRVSVRTLDRYITSGALPSTRLTPRTIRIRRVDVEALITITDSAPSPSGVDAGVLPHISAPATPASDDAAESVR